MLGEGGLAASVGLLDGIDEAIVHQLDPSAAGAQLGAQQELCRQQVNRAVGQPIRFPGGLVPEYDASRAGLGDQLIGEPASQLSSETPISGTSNTLAMAFS